jgi:hypothetical protein
VLCRANEARHKNIHNFSICVDEIKEQAKDIPGRVSKSAVTWDREHSRTWGTFGETGIFCVWYRMWLQVCVFVKTCETIL